MALQIFLVAPTALFFWEKKTYLLIVDYVSCYVDVAYPNVPSACTVIAALKDAFRFHGKPATIVSDNISHYSCELFRDFSTDEFTHSSPRYPQAKGGATVKGLWKGEG